MERVGYPQDGRDHRSPAGTGGQMMPPVIGGGALIMSKVTRTPCLAIERSCDPAVL